MAKKERDSKFVIYQVLYIFVITVLALKGADLDLRKVVSEDQAVDMSVKDSLVALIDSLYAEGLNFTIEIDPNIETENIELREKLASLNQKVQNLNERIREIPPEEREPEEKPVEEQTKMPLPITVAQTFIQHTWNKAKNTGNVPTYILDPRNPGKPLAVIQPGEEKTFDLTDQPEVIARFGSQEEIVKVLPNRPPEIKIESVSRMMQGSRVYVRDLQRITAFTVTIIDERPDQIKVTHQGPISVTGPAKDSKGNLVYNVSLNLAATENRFEEWLDRNRNLREADGRYKVNFFFIAVDEKTNDRVQVGDSFYFTDFSK